MNFKLPLLIQFIEFINYCLHIINIIHLSLKHIIFNIINIIKHHKFKDILNNEVNYVLLISLNIYIYNLIPFCKITTNLDHFI